MPMEVEIRKVKEHYEFYTENGEFICSCDTNELSETLVELKA